MPHYRASIDTAQPAADVFAYLSDFSTTAEWDPGVLEAERLSAAPTAIGTEFRIVAAFLGRRTELIYRIVEYDEPHAVTLRGENATVTSTDRITINRSDGRTRITYDANLELKGRFKVFEPLLALVFRRVGDRALAGLRTVLGPPAGTRQPPVEGARHAGG